MTVPIVQADYSVNSVPIQRAGRKPIGVTRKISLTLPKECWDEIDRHCQKGDYSISEVIRSIIDDYLIGADRL